MSPEFDFSQSAATNAKEPSSISVAMCTYNGERFLCEQFESILNQTRPPNLVVICDDGSTDGTRAMLTDIARTSPVPVELRFNTSNLGVARNFEQALLACTGDFVALSDQDDRWHPTKLQRLAELLEANPQAGFACSDADLIDEQGRSLPQTLWQVQKLNAPSLYSQLPFERRDYLIRSNCVTGATMMLRRNRLWDVLVPIPTSWVHDHWVVVLCEILNATCCATTDLLTQYRLHPGQTIGLNSNGWFRHRVTTAEKMKRFQQREQRYRDLVLHLETKVLPAVPEAFVWRDVIEQAKRKLAERVEAAQLPWWQRELNRVLGRHRRAA
jgi:glycosyltransferase involved in cell wall biosynthesis